MDANGCIANSGVVISEPLTNIQFSYTAIDASCFGAADGSITVTPYDGVQPHLVIFGDTSINLFNNNLNSYTINDLKNGTFPVQVEDGNGCRFLDSVIVNQPDSLMVPAIVSDVLCFGNSDGEIDVTISGGTTPYTYAWQEFDSGVTYTGASVSNVPAGDYLITVTDAGSPSCIASSYVEVDGPDSIYVDGFVSDVWCANEAKRRWDFGRISVQILGASA